MALICMLPTNTMNATVSCVFSACYNFTEPITPIMEIVKRYFKGNRVVYKPGKLYSSSRDGRTTYQ